MQFNSRETYLAAVAQWKEEYLQHMLTVRKAKVAFNNAQREGKSGGEIERAREFRDSLKGTGQDLLQKRWDGKIEANRQYLAAKVAVTA